MEIRLIVLWAAAIIAALILIWYSRRIGLRWGPALVLRLGLIAFLPIVFVTVDKTNQQVAPEMEILIVDNSDSIDLEAFHDLRDDAEDWKNDLPGRIVLFFGEQVDYLLSDQWPLIDTTSSNLTEALETALQLITGKKGKILVATDGVVSNPKQVEAILLRAKNIGVDVQFIPVPGNQLRADLYVGEILVPEGVWSDSSFSIRFPIYSPKSAQITLGLTINGNYQEEMVVKVNQGDNLVSIRLQSGSPGIMLLGATIKMGGDQFERNNTTYAAVEVFPPPRVLLVSKGTQSAEALYRELEYQGLEIEMVEPEQLTTSRTELSNIQAIILFDLLAQDLSFEQLTGLQTFVLEFGRSLLLLGGRNSYNLGGYENTLLEPLFPVNLTVPERIERRPTTYVMVLDRSGSMETDEASDVSPIELTKEAAIRAIETLRPDDYLGVLTFNSYTDWNVELTEVGDGVSLRLALDAISQIKASGGTEISQALQEAIAKIIETKPTEYKHILLMSDGESDNEEDTFEKFSVLTEIARRQNITISTVALGYESDTETMSFIAQEGNGRYYQVLDPADLPGVMVSESKAAHSENIQLGETNLLAGYSNHPVLNGFELDDFPKIEGYNAVSSKSAFGAEDILLSGNFRDPLLSSWQVGNGHVVAWMGDMGAEWAPGMASWDRAGEFWHQVIQYSLPDPTFDLTEVQVDREAGQVTVTLKVFDLDRSPLNQLTPEFIFADKTDQVFRYAMLPVGVGEYQVVFQEPAFGGYRGVIFYQNDDNNHEVGVPIVVNYPAEWKFNHSGAGEENFAIWNELLDAELTSFEAQLVSAAEDSWLNSDTSFAIMAALVVILWPLDVAARRWKMPWRRP
jgi:Mg-chelatase subunit ChlD